MKFKTYPQEVEALECTSWSSEDTDDKMIKIYDEKISFYMQSMFTLRTENKCPVPFYYDFNDVNKILMLLLL